MTITIFNRFVEFSRRTGKLWFSGQFGCGERYGRYVNLPGFRLVFGRIIPYEAHDIRVIEDLLK